MPKIALTSNPKEMMLLLLDLKLRFKVKSLGVGEKRLAQVG